MKKYVLTGGPSVGKTTVLTLLDAKGYEIIPEAAHIIITEGKNETKNNVKVFQQRIAEKQIELENKPTSNEIFLDRSLVDGYAYCKHAGVEVSNLIMEQSRGRYDKVFILESLNLYEYDGVRTRNLEFAKEIHEYIRDAYKHFGYEPISVPVLPPEERVEYILKFITS
jgi:predicted ATPase